MPDIIILDSNFAPMLPVVDAYSSLQWTRKYYECGTFELHAPIDFCDVLKNGRYAYRNDAEETGIIEEFGYESDENGQESVYVKGRFLNALLAGRVIESTRNISGVAGMVIYNLASAYAAYPSDTSRAIAKLTLGPVSSAMIGGNVNTQITGDTLMECMYKLCLEQEITFSIIYSFVYDELTFRPWHGLNRTQNQSVNNIAIFSRDYENISGERYQRNDASFKNIAYVAGAGEGADRIIEIVNIMQTGEGRREMYVDARDLQQKDDDGNAITEAAYRLILRQRGLEKLAEQVVTESIDTTINQFGNLVYKQDFDLGDKCIIQNLRIGYQVEQRITEVREVYEGGSTKIEAVFGTENITIKQYIDRRFKNA